MAATFTAIAIQGKSQRRELPLHSDAAEVTRSSHGAIQNVVVTALRSKIS